MKTKPASGSLSQISQPRTRMKKAERLSQVKAIVKREWPVTASQVARHCEVSDTHARNLLFELVDSGDLINAMEPFAGCVGYRFVFMPQGHKRRNLGTWGVFYAAS